MKINPFINCGLGQAILNEMLKHPETFREDLKNTRRQLTRGLHPDISPHLANAFRDMNIAYERIENLSDSELRQRAREYVSGAETGLFGDKLVIQSLGERIKGMEDEYRRLTGIIHNRNEKERKRLEAIGQMIAQGLINLFTAVASTDGTLTPKHLYSSSYFTRELNYEFRPHYVTEKYIKNMSVTIHVVRADGAVYESSDFISFRNKKVRLAEARNLFAPQVDKKANQALGKDLDQDSHWIYNGVMIGWIAKGITHYAASNRAETAKNLFLKEYFSYTPERVLKLLQREIRPVAESSSRIDRIIVTARIDPEIPGNLILECLNYNPSMLTHGTAK